MFWYVFWLAIIIIFVTIPIIVSEKQEKRTNIIFTIIIIFINIYFAFALNQDSIGFLLGIIFFLPLIFIGLYSLLKKFKNLKSKFNILFYTELIILIGSLGSFIKTIAEGKP